MKALLFKTDLPRIACALLYRKLTDRIGIFPGQPLVLSETADPILGGEHYVKVKTRLCGICGTDLRILGVDLSPRSSVFASAGARAKEPMYLGHEVVGEVVEVGTKVRRVRLGDRVTLADDVSCATLGVKLCELCIEGHTTLCLRRNETVKYRGVGGGWSEYFIRHENQLFPIPNDVSDEEAVLIEPISCSLHAVLKRPPKEKAKVLVVGAGMIGLGAVSSLAALGVKGLEITVLARHPFQGSKARALGAHHVVFSGDPYQEFANILQTEILGRRRNRILNEGFHNVYDCVGDGRLLHDAIRWVRPLGTVVLAGTNMIPYRIDLTPIWHREVGLTGVHGYAMDSWEGETHHAVARTIDWIQQRRLKVDGLLTHTFSLSDYKAAFAASMSHHGRSSVDVEGVKAVKVAFDFRRPKETVLSERNVA